MRYNKTNFAAFQNFLLAKYERYIGKVENHSMPYFIALDPSSVCQLKCPFCPTGVENASKINENDAHFRNRSMMSSDLFTCLIEELGNNLFYLLFYNWGEPLFNKHLSHFISTAKKYNIYTEIHTNLSFIISDTDLEQLLISGIDEIGASIDGFSQEVYQTYRQGGNFELAKSNLTRLASIRDRLKLNTKLVWNYLVFSFNENEIKSTQEYCEEIGIVFNRRDAFIDIKAKPEWLPSYRKNELNIEQPVGKDHQTTEDEKLIPIQPKRSCSWHYSMSAVNSDGSVSPCCAPWDQKDDFGFVIPNKTRFSDIWNNRSFLKSRAVFASKPIGQYSDFSTICEHCPFGTIVQDLYTYNEKEIIDNFKNVYPLKNQYLSHAFRIIEDKDQFIKYCKNNYDHLFNREIDDGNISKNIRKFIAKFLQRIENLFQK